MLSGLRHRTVLSSATILGLLAAAGCGGDGDSGGGGDDGLGEEVTVQNMEPNPAWEGEDIELEFWTFVDAHSDYMINRAEEFNAANSDYNILLQTSSAAYADMHGVTSRCTR
jgi:ABC-type glycerol-3-phosphate transport system substrate-binding protein